MLWQVARRVEVRTTLVRRVRALLAVAALAPAALFAQQPTSGQPGTYTVKRGDTLWDLAKRFLNDAYLWPQIYRLNTDKIRDPHWIYPGEVLQMPQAVAAAPAPTPAPVQAPAAAPAEPEQNFNEPTVFAARTREATTRRVQAQPMVEPAPAVRQGEYTAAPYVDRVGGPSGAGKILSSAEIEGIASAADPGRYQKNSRIFISPPAGANLSPGAKFVSYRLGPELEGMGQMVIPTGVIRVITPPRPGESTLAEVLDMFGEVRPGQNLIPYESIPRQLVTQLRPTAGGPVATVKWVYEQPVLPSEQAYLVIDASARHGLKMGDRVQLFRESRKGAEPGDLTTPEIPIGGASVVRVTPYASTILVTGVEQPKIEVGTRARLTARMP